MSPTGELQSGRARHIGERSIVIVMKKMTARPEALFSRLFHRGSVDEKDVGPSIFVVIQDRHTAAGRFDDVLLCVDPSVYVFHTEPSLPCYVDEPGRAWMLIVDRVGTLA